MYANFAHYIDFYGYVKQSRSWSDTKNMLFNHPGWLPDYLGGVQTSTSTESEFHKYNADVPFIWAKLYIFIQFIGLMLITAFFLFTNGDYVDSVKLGFLSWIVWTSIMLGMLFENSKKRLMAIEISRLLLLPVGIYGLIEIGYNVPNWSFIAATVFVMCSGISSIWIFKMIK